MSLFENSLHIPSRTFYLGGSITEKKAQEIVEGLHILAHKARNQPIHIIISSFGGEVDAGLGIYDAISLSPCPTVATIFGPCQSMALIILQACDTRLASPNSTLMMHSGAVSTSKVHTLEFIENAKEFQRQNDHIDQLFSMHTGLSLAKIKELSKFATYFTPKEAIKHGLLDGIISRKFKGKRHK